MADPLATVGDVEERGHPVTDLDEQAKLESLLRRGSAQ